MLVIFPALFTCKGKDHHARHIEGSYCCAKKCGGTKKYSLESPSVKGSFDNCIFRIETSKGWNTNDCQISKTKGGKGNRHKFTERAIATHIYLIVHTVHDRSCTQEHSGLKESVCQQVHDGKGIPSRSKAGTKNHVTDLRHC